MHDFKKFPELSNRQMQLYQFESPHPQITETFHAEVVKVHDGDSISVRWEKRDFDTKVRIDEINTPELNEPGGHEAREWLEERILNKTVEIQLNPKRVEKWGRILGTVHSEGMSVGEELIIHGHATPWDQRHDGKIRSPIKGIF